MEVQNLEFGGVISDFPVSLQIPPLLAEPSPPLPPGSSNTHSVKEGVGASTLCMAGEGEAKATSLAS